MQDKTLKCLANYVSLSVADTETNYFCKTTVTQGAFTYDIRFLGRQVGQAPSDFTKQAYVVKYLITLGCQIDEYTHLLGTKET